MTWFVGIVLVATALVTASASDKDARRILVAVIGLLLAASTRNLLWIFVGFETYSLAATRFGGRTLVGSAMALGGLASVALAARTTDLAALDPTPAVIGGMCLLALGLAVKWSTSRKDAPLFLLMAVALVAVAARAFAWAPGITDALGSTVRLAAVAAVVVAGIAAALTSQIRTLALWLTVSMVGVSVVALTAGTAGTTALPHVLSHVAASSLLIALVLAGAPPAATWLAMLSLASVPPFPGFVTKLALLAALPSETLTLVLVGLFLAAIGCVKELERVSPTMRKRWITVVALAIVLACGFFPESFLGIAARAASGLF